MDLDSFFYKFVDIFCFYLDNFIQLLFSDSNYLIHPILMSVVVLLFVVLVFAVFRFILNLFYRR